MSPVIQQRAGSSRTREVWPLVTALLYDYEDGYWNLTVRGSAGGSHGACCLQERRSLLMPALDESKLASLILSMTLAGMSTTESISGRTLKKIKEEIDG